ncbi:MAG: hypothetical protein RIS88_2755 [Pseudomonadota bacterium]|jgi:hypothetical protein
MSEQWRPVVGYEGLYEVSDAGRVRSLARTVRVGASMRPVAARMLTWRTDDKSTGYVYVSLCREGRERKAPVHLLVLAAFVGPAAGLWGLHRDGNRANPALGNLYYGTPKDNSQDMVRHGRSQRGVKAFNALLDDELVGWIRESRQSSLELAPLLGVHSSTIRAARLRKNWRHV